MGDEMRVSFHVALSRFPARYDRGSPPLSGGGQIASPLRVLCRDLKTAGGKGMLIVECSLSRTIVGGESNLIVRTGKVATGSSTGVVSGEPA